MGAKFGIDLLAIFDAPISLTSVPSVGPLAVPAQVARFLARLSVLTYDAAIAEERIVYSGLIQSGIFQDVTDGQNLDEWPLRIPGLLETGVPFRLLLDRLAIADGQQIEGSSGRWLLQINAGEIIVTLPFRPARYNGETATQPAYLTLDPDNHRRSILKVEAGILEITSQGEVRVRPDFTLSPNPYSGALVRFRFDPKQFFIIEEAVGVRAGEVILDLSDLVSPPPAERAGFGPTWQGVYLEELGFYFPRDTPFIVPKSLTLRQALIGNAFAGEGILEMADAPEARPQPTFLHVVDSTTTRLVPGANNIIELPIRSELTGLSAEYRIIAVADVAPPWGARRTQARWLLPNGERFAGARTEILSVRPGDTIEYFYEVPSENESAGGAFEAPDRQVFMFQSDGAYLLGATARLQLLYGVTDAISAEERTRRTFNDVTHINAPIGWFADAQVRAVDENGNPLERTIPSSWIVGYGPAIGDNNTVINLREHVPSGPLLSYEGDTFLPHRRMGLRIGLDAAGVRRFMLVDILLDQTYQGFNAIIVSGGQAYEFNSATLTRTEIALANITHTYHLLTALGRGELREMDLSLLPPLTDGASGNPCEQLFPGRLYEVNPVSSAQITQPAQPPRRPRMISLFFERNDFQESDIYAVDVRFTASEEPTPTRLATSARQYVREQLSDLRSGFVYIVGRSSTLGDNQNDSRSTVNENLAQRRAATGAELVRSVVAELGEAITVADRDEMQVGADWREWAAEPQNRHRIIDRAAADTPRSAPYDVHRQTQRVDLFLVPDPDDPDAQWPPPVSGATELVSVERRALIPCFSQPTRPPVEYRLSDSALKRLRLSARWDREAFPVKMEILAVLRTSSMTVATGTDTVEITDEMISIEEDLWRLILRLIYDTRSRQARWSFVLDAAGEADGLVKGTGLPPAVGSLLVFGPLFARMVETEPEAGGWVSLATLLGVGVIGEISDIVRDVNVVLNGLSFDVDTRNGPFDDFKAIYVKIDYSVEFHVRVPLLNLRTEEEHPIRIRYKDVGIALTDPFEDTHFLFEQGQGSNIAIEDAGKFEADSSSSTPNILGNLVQVVGARLGQGSIFLELDLQFALDIGILEVNKSTIRLVFKDGGIDFDLRGLGVSLDIPGALRGTGALALRDGGFRASLDLTVIPADLRVAGSLEFYDRGDFKAVAVGLLVTFPTGLPLAATGLGIYGFLGHFAVNMARAVPKLPDPIDAELTWLGRLLSPGSADPSPSNSPWRVERNAWAFGVGAVIGTLADGARSFHAVGALVIELPGPSIIFGIDARFLQARRNADGDSVSTESQIRGLIALTPEAFIVGIDINMSVGDLLKIAIPIRALFPLPGGGLPRDPAYLRIGSDGVDPGGGHPARTGKPVSVQLNIADFVDLQVFAFLMIEERSLRKLGGNERLNFDGFSVGFGLGISLFIGSRDAGIYLEASALVLAGMGTSPLVIGGIMEVQGALHILVLSLSISARIAFLHREPGPRLPPGSGSSVAPMDQAETIFEGEFCGELKLLFFSISACVGFKIGTGERCAVPAPPPLITGISFIDRRGFAIARVTLDENGALQGEAVVWPDTVPVLHFRTEPDLALDTSSPFAEALTSLDHAAEVSVGSYRYAFTLVDLQLEQEIAGTWQPIINQLDAAWWFPSAKPAFLLESEVPRPSDESRYSEESRELGLLTWHPAPWLRALVPGTHSQESIGRSFGALCEAYTFEPLDCAYFVNAQLAAERGAWYVPGEEGRADVIVRPVAQRHVNLAQLIGEALSQGQVTFTAMEQAIWDSEHTVLGRDTSGALRLAQFTARTAEPNTFLHTISTLETHISLRRPQYNGSLILAVSIFGFESRVSLDDLPIEDTVHGVRLTLQVPTVVVESAGAFYPVAGVVIGDFVLQNNEQYVLLEFRTEASVLGRAGSFERWIIPPARTDVQVVQLCGLDARAREQAERANQRRSAHRERLSKVTQQPSDTKVKQQPTDIAAQFVLNSDTLYRVRVRWSWRGWPQKDPDAEREGRVECEENSQREDIIEQTFPFATAPAFIPLPTPSILREGVTSGIDQTSFDVRDVVHYITSYPIFADPPTFLLDPLNVHFSVNHLKILLGRYDRELILEIQRTDAPVSPDAPPPIRAIQWAPLLADAAEALVLRAIRAQPCLPERIPGSGRQALIETDLAPNARYDLLIYGRHRGQDESPEHALILRTPFRSSRYDTPAALLAAIGFGSTSYPNLVLPCDAILDLGRPPAALDPREPNDVDLAEGLRLLGLEDLNVSPTPRTTVIWMPAEGGVGPSDQLSGWWVLGVLIEADEPLNREKTLTLVSLSVRSIRTEGVDETLGGLIAVRTNSERTRILFMADAPIELPMDRELRLELVYRHEKKVLNNAGAVDEEAISGSAVHRLWPQPETIRWEV